MSFKEDKMNWLVKPRSSSDLQPQGDDLPVGLSFCKRLCMIDVCPIDCDLCWVYLIPDTE